MSIIMIESSEEKRIYDFLSIMDEFFIPTLSDRVNLTDYANKVARQAINIFLVHDGVDVAHAAFYCNDEKDHNAYISSIGVLPRFHGSGVADCLLQEVSDRCLSERMLSLRLEVNDFNYKAVRFYEKHGFRSVGNHVMQKDLLGGYSS